MKNKINFTHPDNNKRMVGYIDGDDIVCAGKGGVRKRVPMSETKGNS